MENNNLIMENHVKTNKNYKNVYQKQKVIYKNLKLNLIINNSFKLIDKVDIDDFFTNENENIFIKSKIVNLLNGVITYLNYNL